MDGKRGNQDSSWAWPLAAAPQEVVGAQRDSRCMPWRGGAKPPHVGRPFWKLSSPHGLSLIACSIFFLWLIACNPLLASWLVAGWLLGAREP